MKHDFFNRTFVQVKCAQNPVTVFFFDDSLRMAKLQRPCDFFADRKNVAVRIGAYTKQKQHAAHEKPHCSHDGRECEDDDPDRCRDL